MNSITPEPKLTEMYTLNKFILDELPRENLQVTLIVEEIFVNIVNSQRQNLSLLMLNIPILH